MSEVYFEKSSIRKKYIDLRKNIKDRDRKSLKILNSLIGTKEYKNSKVIGLYKSLESEVNTADFLNYFLVDGKIVAFPKVKGNALVFYKIDGANDTFEKSKFGVYEPKGNKEKLVQDSDIDLLIVPGICFDKFKNRVGFGKGFYDRFLAKTNVKNIAICFEEQVIKNGTIKTTKEDIRVQKIITEENIYD